MVFIIWTITLIMTMQSEIGLVSRNTMRGVTLSLMGITLIVVLVSLIQRRKATWPAGVSRRFWQAKPTRPSGVSQMEYQQSNRNPRGENYHEIQH